MNKSRRLYVSDVNAIRGNVPSVGNWGHRIVDVLEKWQAQGPNGRAQYVQDYLESVTLVGRSRGGRSTTQLRISDSAWTILDAVRRDAKKCGRIITYAQAFSCVVHWHTGGELVRPQPTQPTQPTETVQLLTAILDELRIIRVTLAAQSLGREPAAISQEWLDNAYAAAYAKAKGAIQ